MERETEAFVDSWWANLFGITGDEVWQALTVQPHTRLGDYAGFFVAWRADGIHVSTPSGIDAGLPSRIASAGLDVLQSAEFWQSLAEDLGGELIGPATHHYLDLDPGPAPEVVEVDRSALEELRRLASSDEWEESGLGDIDVSRAFALHEEGRMVAAAVLTAYAEQPRDLGVLVAPSARGRQLVDRVARTAASSAVREHDLARWVAKKANLPSVGAARRLGFQAWCTQLAVRLPD